MKNPSQLIHLQLQKSVCLGGFITISHILAVLAPFFSDIHSTIRWLLVALVMLSWYQLWRNMIARSNVSSVFQADWLADDSWQIIDRPGQVRRVASWALMLSTPALIMLKFKMNNERSVVLVICPDSIDKETHRQLRVRLNTR